jgi:hypothetical protein
MTTTQQPRTTQSPSQWRRLGQQAQRALAQAGQPPERSRLVGIYLNDHLAGATSGTELARRMAGTGHEPAARAALGRLAGEIEDDRQTLLAIMAALGVPVRRYKTGAAWLGEKAGRLKLNGTLVARSPLSSLEELELLRLGVEGKAAGWRTLRELADADQRLSAPELDALIERARAQAAELEELRVAAARRLAPPRP